MEISQALWRRALMVVSAIALALLPVLGNAQPMGSFDGFLSQFEAKAVAAGINRSLYRTLTRGLSPDPRTPDLIIQQPEFKTPIWHYLERRVSNARLARGKTAIQRNKPLLDKTGAHFGVDPFVLAAIWGMESDFGAVLSNQRLIRPIIRSLASVAYQRRGRWVQDEAELIAALRLVQDHGWTAQTLVGSWAGAVGHTQIIVSGLLAHGTDGDGDGVVNPHSSLADAMATTAKFLVDLGYKPGQDWGYEVELPAGFDYMLATRDELRPAKFFENLGVKRVADRVFPDGDQPVFLYVPTGKSGPKFLMTANYLVFKAYNFSDSYALSVAHLTDRLKGSGEFVGKWPRQTVFPNIDQRMQIQRALQKLGFYAGALDGRIGPITQRAYQHFQSQQGLIADGFITRQSLEELQNSLR